MQIYVKNTHGDEEIDKHCGKFMWNEYWNLIYLYNLISYFSLGIFVSLRLVIGKMKNLLGNGYLSRKLVCWNVVWPSLKSALKLVKILEFIGKSIKIWTLSSLISQLVLCTDRYRNLEVYHLPVTSSIHRNLPMQAYFKIHYRTRYVCTWYLWCDFWHLLSYFKYFMIHMTSISTNLIWNMSIFKSDQVPQKKMVYYLYKKLCYCIRYSVWSKE